jgi:putative inorganic carbon (HCO3(-)) transporter
MLAAIRTYSPVWLAVLFGAANAIAMTKDIYVLSALPLALMVAWTAFYRADWLLMLIAFATPLSLSLESLDIGGIGFFFPTEPLMFGLMVMLIMRILMGGHLSREVVTHPVTLALLCYLGWICVTTLTSELPLVSAKQLIMRFWFATVSYYLMVVLFRRYDHIKRFIGLYLGGFLIIMVGTIIHHSMFQFSEEAAHWVMNPFYKDHTSYGAAIALLIPPVIGLLMGRHGPWFKTLLISSLVVLCIALVLSYTRAAWLSLIVACAMMVALLVRIRFHTILALFIALCIGAFYYQADIAYSLEDNRKESSDDLQEHVQSMTNISSDASNLERINRWYCAFRLFEARPLTGWGPGTYQFVYAPFQMERERTIITTRFGDGGNAHSEYLGPLAESGLPGLVSVLIIVFVSLYTAMRLIPRLSDFSMRMLASSLLLGLVTYYTHGALNNFLDTDKIGVLFWGFTAAIVAMDLYHRPDAPHKDRAIPSPNN